MSTPPRLSRSSAGAFVFWGVGGAALLYALWAAWRRSWICDDAFVSYRYAENLVHGLGLVFNPGERVEGYSNFLWTLWSTLGLSLGADVERWSKIAGIACYAGALGALLWQSWTNREEASGPARWVPIAAVLGAVLPDWNLFATSGLETSLYTLQIVLVYVLLARGEVGAGRAAVAGLLLAAAAMTRPDGLVLAVTIVLYVAVVNRRQSRTLIALAAAFLVVWVPYTWWRLSYYGDFFPNTYYAKSAGQAWVSQGMVYAALFFARYWPLLLGLAIVALTWPRAARDEDEAGRAALNRWRRRVSLAAAISLVFTAYVIRVGGDFMFARFLIPVTPLFLVLFELGVARFAAGRPALQWIALGIAAAGIAFTPYPLPRDPFGAVRGIVFEPNYYSPEATGRTRDQGLALRPFFAGLPVRMAFFGGEARLVYYARPQVAIECATGLTDRKIAHQVLKQRGRIGHEKLAPLDYLLDERGAHLSVFPNTARLYQLDKVIPTVEIEMNGVRGRILTWDPALMDSMRRRGARVQDFPAELDRLLAEPGLVVIWGGWSVREKLRRFYFGHASDPDREALLEQRVREAGGGPPALQ
jgi:hypothetical protein